MITLLVALGAMVVGGGVVGMVGYTRKQARERAGEHYHVWAPWEDVAVTEGWGPPDLRESVAGQQRECLNCGLKETRKVEP